MRCQQAIEIGAIRQRMRLMPVTERMTVFASAVANKNTAIRRALESDPLNEQLLPAEYVERVVTENLQLKEGVRWQRLQTLEFVADRLATIATALDLSLKGYGKVPAFEGRETRTSDLELKNTQEPPSKGPADQPPTTTSRFQ